MITTYALEFPAINTVRTHTMNAISVSGELLPEPDPSRGAAGCYRNLTIGLRQELVPQPGEDEVLVRVLAVSICGSDVHLLSRSAEGRPASSCPAKGFESGLILGHEFSGEVVETGRNVTEFSPGELVTAESILPCRKAACLPCGDRAFNYCRTSELVGFQRNGVFAEYVVLPKASLHSLSALENRLGRETAIINGTQIEPLGVALNAISTGLATWTLKRRPKIRILGAGPVGLYVALIAQMMDLKTVIEEPISNRRRLAALFGDAQVPSDVLESYHADIILDCYGSSEPESLLSKVREGGSIVYLARTAQKLHLSIDALMNRGAHICGIRGHIGYMEKVLEFILNGQMDPSPIITSKIYGLDTLYERLLRPESFYEEGKVVCLIDGYERVYPREVR